MLNLRPVDGEGCVCATFGLPEDHNKIGPHSTIWTVFAHFKRPVAQLGTILLMMRSEKDTSPLC